MTALPPFPSPTFSAVAAAIIKKDFYAFLQTTYPIVSGGKPLILNWHLEAITFALSEVLSGRIKRLIITVPPRSLKSICASVALPAYALGLDPSRRIICVSYSDVLARKFSIDSRDLMRSPLYRAIFPKTRISTVKDTETEFMTGARGYRLAMELLRLSWQLLALIGDYCFFNPVSLANSACRSVSTRMNSVNVSGVLGPLGALMPRGAILSRKAGD